MFTLALVLLTVGCGSASSETAATDDPPTTTGEEASTDPGSSPDPDAIVFIWEENGGCLQGGPNCARYEVTADGGVSTFRAGDDDTGPVATGSVSSDDVAAWIDMAGSTDIDDLTGRVGPGELTAAFDGVDYQLSAPFANVELSSVDVEFDEGEPFFAAATSLARAAGEAAPLPIEMR